MSVGAWNQFPQACKPPSLKREPVCEAPPVAWQCRLRAKGAWKGAINEPAMKQVKRITREREKKERDKRAREKKRKKKRMKEKTKKRRKWRRKRKRERYRDIYVNQLPFTNQRSLKNEKAQQPPFKFSDVWTLCAVTSPVPLFGF